MATICEMALLALVARIYYRHTAQAHIGQLASKYRRMSVNLRPVSESLARPYEPITAHRRINDPPAQNETVTVVTSPRSVAAPVGVDCNAAAVDTASDNNSASLVLRMTDDTHETGETQPTDVDSGCSSFDENDIVIPF